ncbi:hypothetical protein HME9302_01512 [Alteripontixanthobacter maritimus]|uniref:PilZ domain-containing protein n=1 Tax=Alteripontixanthobacter maritimus TaxID=2161824 RepID=A0A369Q7E2_9SPHN|nr:PilZ domain-containing protein [Alteripontixanthobacter maritimus]RDC60310.1 hypothetical protein HME9302_01512 [Alteripontixanthobacter maritimus]
MRIFNRFQLDEEIDITIHGVRDTATLYNLSSGGCMLETDNADVTEGALITVRLNSQTQMDARVVWRMGKNVGIKFSVPLHPAVVSALGYDGTNEEFDSYDPRDRFGIPLIAPLHMGSGFIE